MVRESTVTFLQLNAAEVALQLTLQDYNVFRQIEPTEYIDDLFELKSNYGTPALTLFAEVIRTIFDYFQLQISYERIIFTFICLILARKQGDVLDCY